jgi:tetratricopeptide (TPR) repeat protein
MTKARRTVREPSRRARCVSLVAALHLCALTTPAFAQSAPNAPMIGPKAPVKAQSAPGKAAAKPAAPVDLIQKGQAQFDEQQYEESIQTLSAALLRPSNTPAQKVEIYRLLALDYITLGRKDEAENAVRGLLVQQPDYEIPAKESPRFRDFFAQARAKWEAEGRPGIAKEEPTQKPVVLKHGSPTQVEAGTTVELRARLDDPDGRTGSVKLYYRSGSKGDFEGALAEVDGAASVHATIPGAAIKPPVVDYYFEVLDGSGSVIASRGDASSPLRIAVPEASSKGWVLPVAIGGGVLGAAAIVGVLALAGVFKSSGGGGGTTNGRGTSTVSISVGEASR